VTRTSSTVDDDRSARPTPPPPAPELLGAWRATGRADLVAHVDHFGPLPAPGPGDRHWGERFAAALDASGLTGRGGAAFPSARKMALVRGRRPAPTVVVNACEGEPASSKDAALLSCAPHLVLDGAELAALASGADRIVVCVGAERPDVAVAVDRAVAERVGSGHDPVPVAVERPPGRFVAGEESALVSWLGGGPAAPTFRPRRGEVLLLGRRPALVHNAETLAHVALVARLGPAAFRSTGLPEAPGTLLCTVSGAVTRPGVYEVAMGTPVLDVVGGAGPEEAVGAVLTGGFGGSWIGAGALGAPYAPAPLARVGGVVGAGVLVVLPRSGCGIAETARIAAFMAGESAGQCGPCVFGLPALAGDLAALAQGRADRALPSRLARRLEAVDGRGACRHPDGVVRMVRSALAVFAGDAGDHLRGAPCPGHRRPSVLPRLRAG